MISSRDKSGLPCYDSDTKRVRFLHKCPRHAQPLDPGGGLLKDFCTRSARNKARILNDTSINNNLIRGYLVLSRVICVLMFQFKIVHYLNPPLLVSELLVMQLCGAGSISN